MAFATTGDMAAKLGCFILSPFTGGWLRLQCKGTIHIVNGCFQLTKIGVFRLTRNGDYRLTLTPVGASAISSPLDSQGFEKNFSSSYLMGDLRIYDDSIIRITN